MFVILEKVNLLQNKLPHLLWEWEQNLIHIIQLPFSLWKLLFTKKFTHMFLFSQSFSWICSTEPIQVNPQVTNSASSDPSGWAVCTTRQSGAPRPSPPEHRAEHTCREEASGSWVRADWPRYKTEQCQCRRAWLVPGQELPWAWFQPQQHGRDAHPREISLKLLPSPTVWKLTQHRAQHCPSGMDYRDTACLGGLFTASLAAQVTPSPSGTHSDHAVGAVAAADAVQALHEADEAVEELPLLLVRAGLVPVHVAVRLPLHDALGGADAGGQQQEPRPPELERLDEAVGMGKAGQGSAPCWEGFSTIYNTNLPAAHFSECSDHLAAIPEAEE